MTNDRFSGAKLAGMIASRFAAAVVVLAAGLFIPAGTWDYWEAWVYIALILIPAAFVVRYLVRYDRGLMERRTRMKEPESRQRLIIGISFAAFLILMLLPGLDRRFGWSDVPVVIVATGDILVGLGYLLVFLVYRENTFTSRIVEVEKGQRLIDSGPYSVVRHPMYAGTLAMFLGTPLALGSYWAILPALLFVPILVARIVNEEQVLARGLTGYSEYLHKVRYRMMPGIW